MKTEVGKISDQLHKKQDKTTPLKRKLAGLGRILVFIALGLCALIMVLQGVWTWKRKKDDYKPFEAKRTDDHC